MHVVRLAWCVAASLALLALAPKSSEPPPSLGTNVIPRAYDLTLNLGASTSARTFGARDVEGDETIVVTLHRASRAIALNAIGIAIERASIDDAPLAVQSYPAAQQVALRGSAPIRAGRHVVRIVFRTRTRTDEPGLWSNSTDAKAPAFVSLFEGAAARTLFPSFDEPQFRAPIRLRVVAPATWRAISNMPPASVRTLPDGTAVTTFRTTPPIPTYLLTLDAGVFSRVRGSADGVPVTVYARPGALPLARRVLATATASLDFFARDYGVRYPLPKLDVVITSGILVDSEQGYGVVNIFTESVLDGKTRSGILGEQDAFTYVAQPIALQWFGGLVTQRNWGDSWLVYGLTDWEMARAQHALRPALDVLPDDRGWRFQAARVVPLRAHVVDDRDPAALRMIASSETAPLWSQVTAMWAAFVGDDAMRAANRRFLSNHRNEAASVAAYWHAFGVPQAVSYERAWFDGRTLPILDASLACVEHRSIVRVAQQPFDVHASERAPTTWPVPLTLTVNGRTRAELLTTPTATYALGACGQRVVLNAGLRPPYFTRDHGIALGAGATDRLRELEDTQLLYDAGNVGLPALIRAATAYVPSGDFFHVRASLWDLRDAAAALRDSADQERFERAVAPLGRELAEAVRRPMSPFEQNSAEAAYEFLSWVGDHPGADRARSWLLAHLDGGFTMTGWGRAELAAQIANAPDVARALPLPVQQYGGVESIRRLYLGSLPSFALARPVIDSARGADRLEVVASIGARDPRDGAVYLDAHLGELLAPLPPTQQCWALRDAIVDGPFAARSVSAWSRVFARVPTCDARTRRAALADIAAKWMLREHLERQLHGADTR